MLTKNAIRNPYSDRNKNLALRESTKKHHGKYPIAEYCQEFYLREKEKGKNKSLAELSPRGKSVNPKGYVLLFIPEHPQANAGYVFEHRFLIEKIIGRFLKTEEPVHHIDSDRANNILHNLIAFVSNAAHQTFHKAPLKVKPEQIILDGRNLLSVTICLVIWAMAFFIPISAHAMNYEPMATAIYYAEGGARTRHPYGILAHYRTTAPRQACINTIKRAEKRFKKQTKEKDFIVFLSKTYCPIGAANDPRGLNKNWVKNVKHFLVRGKR
jgi:hypothetical protein